MNARPVLAAFIAALALTALIFAVLALLVWAGAGFLVGPVMWFGMPGAVVLAPVLRTALPDGGGLGVMGLALIAAFVQLVAVLTVVLYRWVSRRVSRQG